MSWDGSGRENGEAESAQSATEAKFKLAAVCEQTGDPPGGVESYAAEAGHSEGRVGHAGVRG